MAAIQSFFGIVMAIVALYLLKNAFPQVVRTLPTASLVPIVARETFPESSVRAELDRFVLLELDATNDDEPNVIDLQ